MRAVAIYPERREAAIVAGHPEPAITASDDVLLRVLEVGICGTDREIRRFEYGTPPPGCDYLVLGHECLAEVIETGPEVTGLAPGDLAVPMVRRPCPHPECVACRSGHQDFCSTGDFTERGIGGAHGFLTERIVDHERFISPVPAALRDVAVLVEPLTIAEKAMRQVWDMQERLPWANLSEPEEGPGHGRHGLVLGAGPVGLLGAMVLVSRGFETSVYSREPAGGVKSSIVEAIGARYVSSATHDVERLRRAVGPIDIVYEATGASRLAFDVLDLLDANAIFVFTGVPGRKEAITIDSDRLMRNLVLKNQVILGTVNAGRPAFERAIADLATFRERWPEALGALITGRYPMEAYEDLLCGRIRGTKSVVAVA